MTQTSPEFTRRRADAERLLGFPLLASALLVAIVLWPASVTATVPPDLSAQIRSRLETTGELDVEGIALDRRVLNSVYDARSFEPIWVTGPVMMARLDEALQAAGDEGIDAEQAGASAVAAALADPNLTTSERDILLTDRYLAYARTLSQGSVAPAELETDWTMPRPGFEPAVAVARLLEHGDPLPVLAAMAPASVQYGALKNALRRYRAIASHGWPTLPAGLPIEPGMAGPSVQTLRDRLVAEGDLPTEAGRNDLFDAAAGAGVRRFQSRHGLSEDGRVGLATLRALNVDAEGRAEQIQLNLERLRSMPHDWPATRIEVNAAAAALTLYRDRTRVLSSRVIVGAASHPTPVLSASANAILLDPPWNVPASIVRKEIQPKLRRDPGYLARNHFVLIRRDGGDPGGRDVDWRQITILGQGWRLQQAPGPWNSLGRIKLELPNPFDVYLHDTPARSLFANTMRALSHGCVRVDAVHQLAEALLGSAWSGDAIDQAIAAGPTLRLPLAAPVPVYLLYLTAFVEDDGRIAFRDDIYGRDQRLAAALARLKTGRQPDHPIGPVASSAACPVG